MDDFKRDLIIIGLCCVPLLGMIVWLIFGVKSPQTASAPTTPTTPIVEESEPIVEESDKGYYGIGDTWTVDGQWSITVNSVESTDSRNEYSDKTPDAVYIISYTYENLGFEDITGYFADGYYFSFENESIIDSDGEMGYSYPGDITDFPQETPIGARCNAQSCIGVNHAGDITINVTERDGNDNKQTATFKLEVSQ